MFTIQKYAIPESLEEAYHLLTATKNNVILGGCGFLKMSNKKIGTAIDLSKLELNYIRDNKGAIEIGAMTTFRQLETNQVLIDYFNGVVPNSVKNILGVQFRNVVTVGGTVFSRYGFSDLITALLSLDAEVELYKRGRLPLAEFLKEGAARDIFIKAILPKNDRKASYQMIRNSIGDYPVVNVVVSKLEDDWKISIGARPRRAEVAMKASQYLMGKEVTKELVEEVAQLAVEELAFGSNMRAGEAYRRAAAKGLIKRGILEVISC